MKNFIFSVLVITCLFYTGTKAQWVQTNGLYGGDISGIYINGSNIFASLWNSELILTTDGGVSWSHMKNNLSNRVMSPIVFNGTDIYAGTLGDGVFLSTDNGADWKKISGDLYVTSIAVNDSNIFISCNNGILHSTDKGLNWKYANSGFADSSNAWGVVINGKNIYAWSYFAGMFLSTNNGLTWDPINNGLGYEIYSVALDGKNIYAGTSEGVYLSYNNGSSWNKINNGIPNNTIAKSLVVNGDKIFAKTYKGEIFQSAKNGANWQLVNYGFNTGRITSLTTSGGNLYAGTNLGEIYISTDNGGTWSLFGAKFSVVDVSTLAVSGNNLFAGNNKDCGIFLTADDGETWNAVNNGLTDPLVYALTVNGNDIFVGTGSGVFLSTNSGSDWNQINNGLQYGYFGYTSSIVISGNNLFAGSANYGVFISSDNGTSWYQVNHGLDTYVNLLAVSGNNLFASTLSGTYITTDNGSDWYNLKVPSTYIASFKNFIFAYTSNFSYNDTYYLKGLYCSTDEGLTWNASNSGLPAADVTSITAIGDNIFAGTTSGVFLSTNNGTTWNDVSTGLAYSNVYALAINKNYIFAGTHNGGVWKRPLSEIITSYLESPLLISPENGAQNQPLKVQLVINKIPDAEMYRWQISADSAFTISTLDSTTVDTVYNITSLTANTKYYWRVKGISTQKGESPFSAVYCFTTGSVSGLADKIGLPKEFGLSQNYPNPFNPVTVISYTIPVGTTRQGGMFVQLKVYNILGKEVATLVNEGKQPGYYSVQFNGSRLPSGVYLYRIQAGSFTETKKFILMK